MSLEAIDTGLRHVTCLKLFEVTGWQFKIYGMSLGPQPPAADLVDVAKELVEQTVPLPAQTNERAGLGFVTVHQGEHGDYVLIDWWHLEDLLVHHLFGAQRPHDGELRYGWPRSVSGCIWEMAVPWFERNAWYRHVMSKPEAPDYDAYLATRLEGTV